MISPSRLPLRSLRIGNPKSRQTSFFSNLSKDPQIETCKYLQRSHGITFPWLYQDSPPRLSHLQAVFPATLKLLENSNVFSQLYYEWVLIPIMYAATKGFATSYVQQSLGPTYFPGQFLEGVRLAAGPALKALSFTPRDPDAWNRDSVKSMMTSDLWERYANEFDKLKNLNKIGIQIDINKVHNVAISDVWTKFSLSSNASTDQPLSTKHSREFGTVKLLGMSRSDEHATLMSGFKFKGGVQLQVDVEATVDYALKIYQSSNQNSTNESETADQSSTIYQESEPRKFLISLTSPFFESTQSLSTYKRGIDEPEWDWNWQISDIDYLMKSKA